MTITGLMLARNEDWILGLSARVAMKWLDSLVILVHSSQDRTLDIAHEVASENEGRVCVKTDGRAVWEEMMLRQDMLVAAREWFHPTHIAMIDADEVLTSNMLVPTGHVVTRFGATNHQPRIRDLVYNTPARHSLCVPGYNLRGSLARYHANGIWGNRWFGLAFVDDPELHWDGDRFHHREPFCQPPLSLYSPLLHGDGGVMHLWGASERRLRAKHAAYKMQEIIRWPRRGAAQIDKDYNQAFVDTGWTFWDVPAEWWAGYGDLLKHVDQDSIPWQERYCLDMWLEHGPDKFQGLDLFGVVDRAAIPAWKLL